mgnify:CR=1 FL=1
MVDPKGMVLLVLRERSLRMTSDWSSAEGSTVSLFSSPGVGSLSTNVSSMVAHDFPS